MAQLLMPHRYAAILSQHLDADHEGLHIREASLEDVAALVTLEATCFDYDQLSRRSFRHFVEAPTAVLLVAVVKDPPGIHPASLPAAESAHAVRDRTATQMDSAQPMRVERRAKARPPACPLAGYILILFHRGTHLARVYSVAVAPFAAGRGLGYRLLMSAEVHALERDCIAIRLEVSEDNAGAITLYRKAGYLQFDSVPDYYENHQTALRFHKLLPIAPDTEIQLTLPYYRQTLEFSCGPAALMMAIAHLRFDYEMSVHDELEIWREATTIFMTSGHGGCGPHGLAIAAVDRGVEATVYVNDTGPLFLDGVRKESKKNVLRLVHQGFLAKMAERNIPVVDQSLRVSQIEEALRAGEVPLVLISTYYFDSQKSPHWVVVTAVDDAFVYIHDPDVDPDTHQNMFDNQHLPIARHRFDRIARFGTRPLRAALILRRPTPKPIDSAHTERTEAT